MRPSMIDNFMFPCANIDNFDELQYFFRQKELFYGRKRLKIVIFSRKYVK